LFGQLLIGFVVAPQLRFAPGAPRHTDADQVAFEPRIMRLRPRKYLRLETTGR
jgi:hypothetical protein